MADLIPNLLFFVFAGILLIASMGVITSRNPVHSALFLVLAFFNSAVLWLLLEAEFLAIVLVLVYVGAVMVLFLFVVMMLDINVEELRQGYTRYAPLGLLVALIVVAELTAVVLFKGQNSPFAQAAPPIEEGLSNTKIARLGSLHRLCVRLRAGRRHFVAGDCRRHQFDHAKTPGTESAEHFQAGGR